MKLYFESEQFLSPYNGKGTGGSLQSRIFNQPKLVNSPKHIYAVVYSTLRYKEHIQTIIRRSKIKQTLQTKKLKISDNLLLLVVHDLLFTSKGRIQLGKHPIKDAILQHKTRLQAEYTKLKLKYKVKSAEDLPTSVSTNDETPIRWFRINTIKTTPEKFFLDHPVFAKLEPISSIDIKEPGFIYTDDYIPNLYGIHPKDKLTSTAAYLNGEVIIQDRASCFPAHILNDDPSDIHTEIIDSCAAPGNKTTHSASYLPKSEDSLVYAFERDSNRVKVLKTMCEKATGAKYKNLIQITHADFTYTNPQDFPNVTGLVVDPSCSGSGIFGRAIEDAQQLQEQEKEEIDTERLNRLAGFQVKIMKHALLFPKVRKIVYSTCSIHPHENERVVVDLLMDPEIQANGWQLASRDVVISKWAKRGWKEEFTAICGGDEKKCEILAGGCVRATPKEDGGIGFFAACFIKKDASDKILDEQKENQEEPVIGIEEESEEQDEAWTGFD